MVPTQARLLALLAVTLLFAPAALAPSAAAHPQGQPAGTVSASAHYGMSGGSPPGRNGAEAAPLDVVAPPSCLLCTSTVVHIVVAAAGYAWISDACNAGAVVCHAFATANLNVVGQGVPLDDAVWAACGPGTGCPKHPNGQGHAMFLMRNHLHADVVVQHGILGINSQSVTFVVCATSQVRLDSDGDGSWSDETPNPDLGECRAGTVRVSPL